MPLSTADFIEALKVEVSEDVFQRLISKLEPLIRELFPHIKKSPGKRPKAPYCYDILRPVIRFVTFGAGRQCIVMVIKGNSCSA